MDSTVRALLDPIFDAIARSGAPGVGVGVARSGQPVYRRGVGMASVQHGTANRPETRMRIASISKHFTSLAILLLAEEGKLDLDAPVNRYLPELPELAGYPTLRQFMSHTSGYRCTLELGTLANGFALQPPGWQFETMARQTGVNFAPGQGQNYCNGTYAALSLVVERLSGLRFASFMRSRIFEPLGMLDTETIADDNRMVPGLASAHVPTGDGSWTRPVSESQMLGDGGMVSTVDDMLRWMAHMHGPKRVGTDATWQQMLEPALLANGTVSTYTLGLRRTRHRGVEALHHSGGIFGVNAYMMTLPAPRLDVVVLANCSTISAMELTKKVVDLMLADLPLEAPRQRARAGDFAHLLGVRYQGRLGMLLQFVDVDGDLGIALMNMSRAPVLWDDGESVSIGFEDIGLGPMVWHKRDLAGDGAEAPALLAMQNSGYPEQLERLPDTAPPAEGVASSLVGRYRSNCSG
jgi:D-aminopeptidase